MRVFFVAVSLRRHRHEDHGQHAKHERLNQTDEQLEHHDHCSQNADVAKQRGDHAQGERVKSAPGEDLRSRPGSIRPGSKVTS